MLREPARTDSPQFQSQEKLENVVNDRRERDFICAPAARDGERRVSLLTLCLLALGVGIMTGIGAVALRALIGLIHNVMINGVFKVAYDANFLEGPSRWGNWVILSPILGGLVVIYLVERLRRRPKAMAFPR